MSQTLGAQQSPNTSLTKAKDIYHIMVKFDSDNICVLTYKKHYNE